VRPRILPCWLTSWAGPKLLSWGFPKIPLHQHQCPTSAPYFRCRRIQSRVVAHPSSRSCQTPRAIRPCRSSRLRRFSPCDPSQVYCTLQPVLRFAPFQSSDVIAPTRLRAVRPTSSALPGSAVFLHTLQSFSLVIRRTASPRPLPSRRRFHPTSRLFSFDKSVVASWCCHQTGPDALLGFVPLQGSPLSLSLQAACPNRTRSFSEATIAGTPAKSRT